MGSAYIGALKASPILKTSNDLKVDPLLVTGVDIPLSNRFTATGRLNIGFGGNKTDVGLLLGVAFSL